MSSDGRDHRNLIPLAPHHDGRHKLPSSPHARESLIGCGLKLPEAGIKLTVYTWVNGIGEAGLLLSAYGPRIGDEALAERFDRISVPDSMDFDDWRVGPLHLSQRPTPFEGVDFSVDGKDIALEYSFDGMHEPYAYGLNAEPCPSFLATERFEQAGRVRGTLTIRGESIPIDTVAHRDHSWGTRDWRMPQHWKWIEAQTDSETAIHVFEIHARGRRWLYGYVYKDGQIATVTNAEVSVENDRAMRLRSLTATITDSRGRTTQMTGDAFAGYDFEVHPATTGVQGSMVVSIDGESGVGHIEQLWPAEYLAYLREAE